jgi:N-acetylglucosamine kinase-like BadF-type ATPase
VKGRNIRPSTGIYLGVDGGGTRTTAWVGDVRGRLIGRGTAGPANPVKVGLEASKREILDASEQALASARHRSLEAICLGLAGADRGEISGPLLKWVRRNLPARFHLVTTDAEIALESAQGRLPKILLIAGTGSIACARDGQGKLVRAGGWGACFDDGGSGFDLGRTAVRAALRALDGRGGTTKLVEALPRALGLRDPREIVGLQLTPAEIGALAPVVIRIARGGDAMASEILDDAGLELASLVLALIRRLGLERQSVSVVCSGGLLRASRVMRQLLRRHLHARAPEARLSVLRREPVEGALALARRLA